MEVQNNLNPQKVFICEFCKKEQDGSYQSGRFCNAKCKGCFIGENLKKRTKICVCDMCKKSFEVGSTAFLRNGRCNECNRNIVIDEYKKNPKFCKKCGKELTYDQRTLTFCSWTCGNGHEHNEEWNKNISDGVKKTLKEHPEILEKISESLKTNHRNRQYYDNIKNKKLNWEYVENSHDSERAKKLLKLEFGDKCQECGFEGKNRKGQSIIEIHHIDGDSFNNKKENVILLCPNCHAKTENFRNCGQKSKKHKAITESEQQFIKDVKYTYENNIINYLLEI